MSKARLIVAGALVLVCFGLFAGFSVLGSPGRARAIATDRRRIEDMRTVASRLENCGASNRLPASLPVELRSGQYTYYRVDSYRYKLCAAFAAPTVDDDDTVNRIWRHGSGRTCFHLDKRNAYDF